MIELAYLERAPIANTTLIEVDATASGRRAPRLKRLVKEAALRGTRLLLMPDGMARRDGNTTTIISDGRINGDRSCIRGGVHHGGGVNCNVKKRKKLESPSSQGFGSAELEGNGECGSVGTTVDCISIDKEKEVR